MKGQGMSLSKLKRLAEMRRLKASAAGAPVESVELVELTDEHSALACAPEPEPEPEPAPEPEPEPMTLADLAGFLDEPPAPAKKRAKPKTPAPTVALEGKMIAAINASFGAVVTKKWGVKERALAKKLIEAYGLEMTEQVIERFVAGWADMVRQSRGRLYGLPTINFLWATQDRFFGAAQLGQNTATTPANIDEYQGVEDSDDDW
jgi:hypothetical protein